MAEELDTDSPPFSAPPARGARFSLPGVAILLVLAGGAFHFVSLLEAGREQPAAPPPKLIVPPGKLVTGGAAEPQPRTPPRASLAPPPLVRLARARSLAEEIHELSRKTAEAQDAETGNQPLIRRLEAFQRSAGNLLSASRAAGAPGSDPRDLQAQVEILLLESGEIDRRATALGAQAGLHWKTLARRLRELRLLLS